MDVQAVTAQPSPPADAAVTRVKTRVIMAFVACLAVWPLVHHALVLTYGLSPWHFCGFAMYCVPRPQLRIDLEIDGKPADTRSKARLRPWITAYADRRQALGELAEPSALARAIFIAEPEISSFDIVVTTFYFDAPSASFLKKVRRYPYTR